MVIVCVDGMGVIAGRLAVPEGTKRWIIAEPVPGAPDLSKPRDPDAPPTWIDTWETPYVWNGRIDTTGAAIFVPEHLVMGDR